ncbi:nyctalopin-like [Anopheles funestus]|uniref:nyctalopin-like n=1 Tax=Anopheles funestus TaxID=62324 RepID=UPI0020C68303|nr:nyctalopin-like [Anopheles funestus]XP_049294578.1 nyctalopin-like [Anopheles funestus]XP_049294579.1 nyctalopin-like [Anopheles funestus]XP_049294580.1 nyctalopin-like [Anopheles funestus]
MAARNELTGTIHRMVSLIMLLVLLTVGQLPTVNSFCPSLCTCESDRNLRTSCINASLEVVPIQLNPDVRYLNLTANQITNVHFTLAFYYQLESLDLSHNRIDSLGSKNFESQEKLLALNLSHNVLQSLLKDSFRGLKRLELLRLDDNQLEQIHPTAFQALTSLRRLELMNNRLVSFEDGVLRPLVALETLLLTNNQLLEVPYEGNLEYGRSLRHLDLSTNLIEYVANDSFGALHELRTLRLAGNVLMEVDWSAFSGLNALQLLDLADNNLTTIPTVQLSKLYNLTTLTLSGNSFVELPAVAFQNLFQLRELHLDRLDRLEHIDTRAFIDNTHLQVLTLDENPSFSALPVRLFHGNPHLIDISMRRNALLTLDAVQFPLDRLQRLKLAGNPLVCNCTIRWLWRLVTGTHDDDDGDDPDGVAFLGKSLADHSNITTVLLIDKDEIGCDLNEDGLVTRRTLRNMSEGDINCPAHLVTVLSILLSLLLLALGAGAAIVYRRKSRERKKILQERKNVHERIVPQKVDKLELERYLAQQVLSNDYRELRPACDLPVRYDLKYPDQTAHQLGAAPDVDADSDHYENIDYLQHQRVLGNSTTPNVSSHSIITNPFHHQPPSQYHFVQGHPQVQSQLHSATYQHQPHHSPHHQHHHQHPPAPAMTMQHPHKYPHQQHHTAGPLGPGSANNSNTLPVPPVQRSLNNYSPNFFIYVLYSHFILLLLTL